MVPRLRAGGDSCVCASGAVKIDAIPMMPSERASERANLLRNIASPPSLFFGCAAAALRTQARPAICARRHFLSGDAEGKVNQFHLQASFVKRTAHFPWHARNAL